jgi:hypothetical protein
MRTPARLPAVSAVLSAVALLGAAAPARAAGGDIGHQDGSFGRLGSPSGTKPESKLWFNHGWWATMFDPSAGEHRIFKLNAATGSWTNTGVTADARDSTRADALWDPARGKLYIASHIWASTGVTTTPGSVGRLYRYSYDPASDRYSLDAGFPARVNSAKSETLVIDKDSTGTLWATWTQGSQVYVNHTAGGNDAAWGSPYVIPGAGTHVTSDDISSLVHFGGSHIGVMWSNQADDNFYFSVHNDGASDSSWSTSSLSAGAKSDDHVNLKADSSGRVFAAVKTGATAKSAPLNVLAVRSPSGAWSTTTFGTAADSETRPIVVLDDQIGTLHMFATCPQPPLKSGQSGGDICEKTTSMSNPSFAPGPGTPVIREAGVPDMNDATSTKQNVDAATGLVVLAGNATSKTYWHMQASLPSPPPAASQPPKSAPRAPHAKAKASRIRVTVTPRRVRARHRTLFTFVATIRRSGKRVAVRGVLIRFAGKRVRTSRSGHARIRARLDRVGRHRAAATKRGMLAGSVIVVVAHRSHASR